jgi:hypothetical protein
MVQDQVPFVRGHAVFLHAELFQQLGAHGTKHLAQQRLTKDERRLIPIQAVTEGWRMAEAEPPAKKKSNEIKNTALRIVCHLALKTALPLLVDCLDS